MAGGGGNSQMQMWMQLAQFQQQQAQIQSQQLNAQQMREPVIQAQVSSDTAALIRQFSSPYASASPGMSVPFTGMTQGFSASGAVR